jgi:hypothetical protein
MKTHRKLILENRSFGLKVYLNKRNFFEIIIWGKNISFNKETEFPKIIVKPKGLEVFLISGRKSIFLFDSLNWFSEPAGKKEFVKAFLFGDVEASINGELLQNYVLN